MNKLNTAWIPVFSFRFNFGVYRYLPFIHKQYRPYSVCVSFIFFNRPKHDYAVVFRGLDAQLMELNARKQTQNL